MIAAIHTRIKLIAALVLILVFAAPLVAGAECAWVLWVNTVGYETSRGKTEKQLDMWDIVEAFPAHRDCVAALAKRRQEFVTDTKNPEPGVTKRIAGGGNLFIREWALDEHRFMSLHTRFSCYPDTIDPRAPKGGR